MFNCSIRLGGNSKSDGGDGSGGDADEVGISINLDRTPDDFFYDYDSRNTAATNFIVKNLPHPMQQIPRLALDDKNVGFTPFLAYQK